MRVKLQADFIFTDQGPVSRKSRELFGPEKQVVKLQSACLEKLIFLHVFNVRKTKRIAKFEGLEPRRCEDIKAMVAPEIVPKSFGTFEKQAPEFYFDPQHIMSATYFVKSSYFGAACAVYKLSISINLLIDTMICNHLDYLNLI